MAYVKKVWINDDTDVNATNMNNIEDGVDVLYEQLRYMTYERSVKDAENLFTVITYKRQDTTKFAESTLSGGTTPLYTTQTVIYYDTDGITPLVTVTYALTYDGDNDLLTATITGVV